MTRLFLALTLMGRAPSRHDFVGPPEPDYAGKIGKLMADDGFDAPVVGDPLNEAMHKVYEYILQLRCEAGLR